MNPRPDPEASTPPEAPPERVALCEVGLRDGLQAEPATLPTAEKRALVQALAAAGVRRIQAVSFVHPGRVPQMADAEALVASLGPLPGVQLTGLALNDRGLERALAAGLRWVDLSIATDEAHGQANAGMSVAEGAAAARRMLARARAAGAEAQIGLQTVFGHRRPGDVPLERIAGLAEALAGEGAESLSLADSTGMATPVSIRRVLERVQRAAPEAPLVLHLHDTRGLGLANVCAALEMGVRRFDTSLGGLGGCPFIAGATGNIATEDTAYLAEALGYATGIDRAAVAACSRRLSALLGRALPGKLYALTPTP